MIWQMVDGWFRTEENPEVRFRHDSDLGCYVDGSGKVLSRNFLTAKESMEERARKAKPCR